MWGWFTGTARLTSCCQIMVFPGFRFDGASPGNALNKSGTRTETGWCAVNHKTDYRQSGKAALATFPLSIGLLSTGRRKTVRFLDLHFSFGLKNISIAIPSSDMLFAVFTNDRPRKVNRARFGSSPKVVFVMGCRLSEGELVGQAIHWRSRKQSKFRILTACSQYG